MKKLSKITKTKSTYFTFLFATALVFLTAGCSTTTETPHDTTGDRAAYEKFERKIEGFDRRYPYALKESDRTRQ